MTDYMFHGTGIGNLTSISVQGLLASHSGQNFDISKPCVYLTRTHGNAHWWACSNTTDPVILAIDWDKMGDHQLSQDRNVDDAGCREYWGGSIPPELIEVEWGDRWYPVNDT